MFIYNLQSFIIWDIDKQFPHALFECTKRNLCSTDRFVNSMQLNNADDDEP